MSESESRNPKAKLTAEDILNMGLSIRQLNQIFEMPLSSRQVAYLLHTSQRAAQRHLKRMTDSNRNTNGQHQTVKLIDLLTYKSTL